MKNTLKPCTSLKEPEQVNLAGDVIDRSGGCKTTYAVIEGWYIPAILLPKTLTVAQWRRIKALIKNPAAAKAESE